MKIVFLVVATLVCAQLCAQLPTVHLSTGITTSVVFPEKIRHVDLGSAAILLAQVPAESKVILLKAARPRFEPTNLTVVTCAGNVYAFDVVYDSLPQIFTYRVPLATAQNTTIHRTSIQDTPAFLQHPRIRRSQLEMQLLGLYTSGEQLFVQLRIQNNSVYPFERGALRVHIDDRKKAAGGLPQVQVLEAEEVVGWPGLVKPAEAAVFVITLPMHAMTIRQLLVIELGEQAGDRRLRLRVPGRMLQRARVLSLHSSNN